MPKASSHHPSATASPQEQIPGETGQVGDVSVTEEEQKVDNPQASISSATTTPTKSADSNPADSQVVGSQPMTASNSNASNISSKVSGGGDLSAAAATYGTRSSRTRTGTTRPNYAEDTALDAELEITPKSKDKSGRKAALVAEASTSNTPEAGKTATSTPKPSAHETGQNASLQNQVEPIPGISSFSAASAATAAPQGKKRKANNQSTPTAQQHGSTLTSHGGRKGGHGGQTMIAAGFRETNMLTFENCGARLTKEGKLIADDGTVLAINDHVYMICEPPGEPYYLGRIMAWIHVNNDTSKPVESLRLNWYYRPKDIGRSVSDTRQVFASMHTDVNPLTAIRGKCEIKHKNHESNLDAFRATKDCFYFEKLYDRYIHRYYDVVPVKTVINIPANVKKVLTERWQYILAEPARAKEYVTPSKSCKRCRGYCSNNDAVDCAICRNTYHMSCVSPPLLRKPTRGFAWACGPCSKAQAKKLEARNTPTATASPVNGEEEDVNEEEEDSPESVEGHTTQASPGDASDANIPTEPHTVLPTPENRGFLWRYLGIHCNVEDALDADDRIHPRASSRLGQRHQANVIDWPGRPMEYVKAPEAKRKYTKGGAGKKESKFTKEAIAAQEAEKAAREQRPKWVTDEPPGYTVRGEDLPNDDPNNTAQLLYKLPEANEMENTQYDPEVYGQLEDENTRIRLVHEYVCRVCASIAVYYDLPEKSTNLLDIAIQVLRENGYDTEKALEAMLHLDKKIFKEPNPSQQELKKFEDGVSKFGSEWHSIKKHVKTMKSADIVRFYYTWKKTERGKQIWGNYAGRKGKKEAKRAEASAVAVKLQDDVADEYDDSAFDNYKAYEKKRGFQCKFCNTRSSRQWRRAPQTATGATVSEATGLKSTGKDKSPQLMVALCRRCAELWRRLGIQWEDVEELSKKNTFKRKFDEDTIKEILAANEVSNDFTNMTPMATPLSNGGTPGPAQSSSAEPPRKKNKTGPAAAQITAPEAVVEPASAPPPPKKKVIAEKPPYILPLPPPEPPKPKILPCSICSEVEPMSQHLTCRDCRLPVHRGCYGVVGDRSSNKWTCDMCSNDKNPQVAVQYKCVLCPVEFTEHNFVEEPRSSHKKKSEKEREKDRVEREKAQGVADFFRKKQEELNKPVNPREPLKRTANNNWVHVTCAVFTPEVKFGNAKALEPSEGIPSIASDRWQETCKVCKKKGGACVACHCCKDKNYVHVECARQAGYLLGFDIVPVKSSRRDQVTTVNIQGDVGTMVAGIWCKEHLPQKTVVYPINTFENEVPVVEEQIEDKSSEKKGSSKKNAEKKDAEKKEQEEDRGLNALQLYVQNFKQADLTLTGTVRKATLVSQSTKVVNPAAAPASTNRRTSTTNTIGHSNTGRNPVLHGKIEEEPLSEPENKKFCATCDVDISPKWWSFPPPPEPVVDPAPEVNGNGVVEGDSQAPQAPQASIEAVGASIASGHAALAAAALHQNVPPLVMEPVEFQCHKCHVRKVRREPTLPPAIPEPPTPPPPPPPPPAVPAPALQQEDLRASNPLASVMNTSAPEAEMGQSQPQPQYAWPPVPTYPSNAPYNWPRHSPASQTPALVGQINGNHAPRIPAVMQSPNGNHYDHMIQSPLHIPPHSPRQNGHVGRLPNGYPPPSPRRGYVPPLAHVANGNHGPYTHPPPRPGIYHLTNDGPPSRANDRVNDHSFPYQTGPPHAPMHPRDPRGPYEHPPPPVADHRGPYEYPPPTQTSPPIHHNHLHSRENGNPHQGPPDNRQENGRVNGGASASPSLRNLLS